MKPTDTSNENSPDKQGNYPRLLTEIKERIRSAQYEALKAVNQELVGLYWDIGRMIVERQETEGWGKSVVQRLSADLRQEFPLRKPSQEVGLQSPLERYHRGLLARRYLSNGDCKPTSWDGFRTVSSRCDPENRRGRCGSDYSVPHCYVNRL
ncbi:MAG: DUF1016 N-terminal domain-containing protein [Pirellulaceae bacterium]